MTELVEDHVASCLRTGDQPCLRTGDQPCLRYAATDTTEAQPMVYPTSLSISAACEALEIARSTFYRYRHYDPFADPDLELRSRIQETALEWPAYGYRRITAELSRQGIHANRKLVLRLMREDNLLCLRRQRFKIATTDSDHDLPVFKNLARTMVLTGCDQLWVSDITTSVSDTSSSTWPWFSMHTAVEL